MTDQELLEFFSKHQDAELLRLQGIDQFNNGNLKEALSSFEKSLELNPKSIPTLLYHSICCFSLIQSRTYSNIEGITHPESRKHIQDLISNLDIASDLMKFIRTKIYTL